MHARPIMGIAATLASTWLAACAAPAPETEAEARQADTGLMYVLDQVQVKINDGPFVGVPSYNGSAVADIEQSGRIDAIQHFLTGGMGLDVTFYHPRKVISISCSTTGAQQVNFPLLIDDYYNDFGQLVSPGKTNEAARIVALEWTPVFPPFISIRKPVVGAQAIRQSPSIGGFVTAQVASASGVGPTSWVGTLVMLLAWSVDIPEFKWENEDWLNATKLSVAVKFKCKGVPLPPPIPPPVWEDCPNFSGPGGFFCTCSAGFGSSRMRSCENDVTGKRCEGYAGGQGGLVVGTVTSCQRRP